MFENINKLSDIFRLEINHFIVVDLIVCFANLSKGLYCLVIYGH